MKRMDRSGSIPDDELQSVVNSWRDANPNICKLWRDYERAVKIAITECRKVTRGIRREASSEDLLQRMAAAGGPVRRYSVREGVNIEFTYKNHNLFIRLPSGRKLCYWGARLEEAEDGREHIYYMGVNQETKAWGWTETYGGKIVENIVQATARDCLAVAMQRVSALGYEIVMHVHDEMIVDVPKGDLKALDVINDCMAQPIDWAPGLPLKGDGYETEFYKKD